MRWHIDHSPEYASLVAGLDAGESLVAEPGALVAMTPGLDIKTSARGGILNSLKRAVLGGESFFANTFTATRPSRLHLAPAVPGDIVGYELDGSIFLQSSSFLACGAGVKVDSAWGGARGFFSGTGLFLLKLTGTGPVFFNGYGAVRPIDVSGNHVVDTGHIVAFEPSLGYTVRPFGGVKSFFFSSEGLVADFWGDGKVWMQTRQPQALASFLHPYRRVSKADTAGNIADAIRNGND